MRESSPRATTFILTSLEIRTHYCSVAPVKLGSARLQIKLVLTVFLHVLQTMLHLVYNNDKFARALDERSLTSCFMCTQSLSKGQL